MIRSRWGGNQFGTKMSYLNATPSPHVIAQCLTYIVQKPERIKKNGKLIMFWVHCKPDLGLRTFKTRPKAINLLLIHEKSCRTPKAAILSRPGSAVEVVTCSWEDHLSTLELVHFPHLKNEGVELRCTLTSFPGLEIDLWVYIMDWVLKIVWISCPHW